MDRRGWLWGIIGVLVAIAVFSVLIQISRDTIVVTEEQNGQTVEMNDRDTLELQLTGNPTTGYNWQTVDINSAVLAQEGDPTFDPDTELLGAPGVITISYEAVAAGSSPLKLEYKPVAGGDVANTFELVVRVSD
jgi:inhibitor of cysteine peptidase